MRYKDLREQVANLERINKILAKDNIEVTNYAQDLELAKIDSDKRIIELIDISDETQNKLNSANNTVCKQMTFIATLERQLIIQDGTIVEKDVIIRYLENKNDENNR